VSRWFFLGGTATGLLITDPAAGPVRATVDVVVEVVSRSAYSRIQQQLRRAGFVEDERPGAPLCRWVVDGIPLDVMPTDPSILGFANRWYPAVVAAPTRHALREGPEIRLITGPLFVATKLEAFRQRGQSDLYGSRDLEDILAVVVGRAELVMECRAASSDIRSYLANALRKLMQKSEVRRCAERPSRARCRFAGAHPARDGADRSNHTFWVMRPGLLQRNS